MFSIIHDVNWEQQVDCRGFVQNQVSEVSPVNVSPGWTDTAPCLVSDSSQTIGRQGSGGAGSDITLRWRPQVKLPMKAVGTGGDLLLEVVIVAFLWV